MSNIKETYALITGGSSGIGRCMAIELAERGYNLLLVALHDETLAQTHKELVDRYQVDVDVRELGVDLTDPNAAKTIYDFCKNENINVQILINNAGFGYAGRLDTYSVDFFDKLMNLNNVAMVKLSRYFIDELKKHDEAFILNVGSIASYYDTPYKSVYAASKKFVYSFSRGIRAEFRNTGVSVTVLTPAGVMTNENVKSAADALGWKAKIISYTPEEVAAKAVKGMLNKKAVIIPGFFNKVYISIRKILPNSLTIKIIASQFEKKEVPVYDADRLEVKDKKEEVVEA
ncbi:MAG: SDR family NAD(P)-dependent oxidoreductase [Bacteroidia bacterium]